ncbi:hypothetical protein OX88_21540 [Pseudomonas coronafaciens pv. porri]|uniref:hypothetical protein n=1 Tax=Pseudomonas coronafaciens TaxID=53409 RepID=UPI0006ABA149|nr:hypothetical protein [Pseudomonas coronafaciens]KOP53075.1 hypothetical protein OX88_21540 [Pseudomonas coronafaciens pv. porri]
MKISKLAIALATFATIALSSAAYISTKEITSAVFVDKAKHSIDLLTNGLYHISVEEAYAIDKSEAAQISFLRCSFARPEFRFSWFCHQQKKDGKMTKYSYAALKQDQESEFQNNFIRSLVLSGFEFMKVGMQLSKSNSAVGSDVPHLQKKVYASDLNKITSGEQGYESKASDVVKTTAPYSMLFGIGEDESKLFGDKESIPASLNYHDDDDMLELTKSILKNGRREGGLTHYDNPIEKHILSIVDNISGAKSIGDIYKEIILEEEFKMYSNTFWFSPSFNRDVANKFVEYRYNAENFTIERRYIYQDHLPMICLVLFLTIFVGGHISTTIEENSKLKRMNTMDDDSNEK